MSNIFVTSFLKWLLKFGGISALSLGMLYVIFKIILKTYLNKDFKERGVIVRFIIISLTIVVCLAIIIRPPDIGKVDSPSDSSSNSSGSTNSSKKQNGVS